MIRITFFPDSDIKNYLQATAEYQKIWNEEGERIVNAIESISSLKFKEKFINAMILERPSQSHPMTLRASLSIKSKKATIVHELCHRLLSGNGIRMKIQDQATELNIHKNINLILFDIWNDLFGENFAKENVERESRLGNYYREAWIYVLSLSKEERAKKFKELINK